MYIPDPLHLSFVCTASLRRNIFANQRSGTDYAARRDGHARRADRNFLSFRVDFLNIAHPRTGADPGIFRKDGKFHHRVFFHGNARHENGVAHLRTLCHVDIIKQHEGADPAAVVFDATSAARARKADVVLVDTAGRLHNKQNLMNELNKISRVLDRELPGSSRETLLVLDATTGQNAISQAEGFNSVTGLTGLVITKLDGTAKGGIAIHVSSTMQVPVKFVGVGEQVDDLLEFDALDFTRAFFDEKEGN